MIRTPVTSSNVVSVGYDDDNHMLEVEYRTGVYRYLPVTRDVYDTILRGTDDAGFTISVGKMIGAIKSRVNTGEIVCHKVEVCDLCGKPCTEESGEHQACANAEQFAVDQVAL